MPWSAKRPCRALGCPNISERGSAYCKDHQDLDRSRLIRKESDERRGTAAQRGYDGAWQKARKGYLAKHPLCASCLRGGKYTPATVVDHIIPHRGDKNLFWDSENWQSLCKQCHDRKTARGE